MIDEKRLSEYEKHLALNHMDRLAKELTDLERKQRDMRIEYWRWQAIAYPVYECHHPDTHFCSNCFDQAQVREDG